MGFSFLIAAPLILLVFATFLVGGNVQTLVCQSWESKELYKVTLPVCSGALREVEGTGLSGSWGGLALSLLRALFSLPRFQFADTPGNLPPSMNLSQLLGLKKNISILLAYQ